MDAGQASPGTGWHWLADPGTWDYFSLRRKKGPTWAGEKALRLWAQPDSRVYPLSTALMNTF